ncbi:MAG: extradiol dioxygenase family protein, partial [Pirellulaceae bacterium]
MNRLGCFLSGIIVGAFAIFFAMSYHVVNAHDGMHAVPKVSAKFSDIYVDIRHFGIEEWDDHRALALAIYQADKAYLLQDSATEGFRQTIGNV